MAMGESTSLTLPTRAQELLLMAALLAGEPCAEALRRWRNVVPIRRVDQASGWLLPLLYCNLRQQRLTSPDLARYQFVFRHNWYKNNLFIREVTRVCAPLVKEGVEVVWLRGAGLNIAVYDDVGARPINHVDLWVAAETRESLVAALVANGWSEAANQRREQATDFAIFFDSFGRYINLYGQLFTPKLDAAMWGRTVRLPVKQGAALTLDPIDHLVYLCANVAAWDARSTLLWVADAAKLIMCQENLDWARVEEELAQLPAPDDAMRVLGYVVKLLGLSMPEYLTP